MGMGLASSNGSADLSGIPEQFSGSSTGYQDTLANLTREKWDDFKARYLPVQDHLLDLASNNTLLNSQLERNKENINKSFDDSNSNESLRAGRFGIEKDNSKQNNTNRNLLKNLTLASMNNETRSTTEDIQNRIRTGQGGTPNTLADIGAQ